ncbi:MAG: hypothetical protein ACODAQ_13270 [Phycisphaeraceae bacterium]
MPEQSFKLQVSSFKLFGGFAAISANLKPETWNLKLLRLAGKKRTPFPGAFTREERDMVKPSHRCTTAPERSLDFCSSSVECRPPRQSR